MQNREAAKPIETTRQLIQRCNAGGLDARGELVRRNLPVLQRWARGRLPLYGRDLPKTEDLMRTGVILAFRNLKRFETTGEGAFLAYLRTMLLSCAHEEVQKNVRNRQGLMPADSNDASDERSQKIARTVFELEAFEELVNEMNEPKRSAVILRVEMGQDYDTIFKELELDSPNAARLLVQRGLAELARKMNRES
ncbi:MAG: hypothetical protein AAGJ52_00235 [Pseudomonadota bacterium]